MSQPCVQPRLPELKVPSYRVVKESWSPRGDNILLPFSFSTSSLPPVCLESELPQPLSVLRPHPPPGLAKAAALLLQTLPGRHVSGRGLAQKKPSGVTQALHCIWTEKLIAVIPFGVNKPEFGRRNHGQPVLCFGGKGCCIQSTRPHLPLHVPHQMQKRFYLARNLCLRGMCCQTHTSPRWGEALPALLRDQLNGCQQQSRR